MSSEYYYYDLIFFVGGILQVDYECSVKEYVVREIVGFMVFKKEKGKVFVGFLFLQVFFGVVEVFGYGVEKYGVGNWKNVLNSGVFVDVVVCYLLVYLNGYVVDELGWIYFEYVVVLVFFVVEWEVCYGKKQLG